MQPSVTGLQQPGTPALQQPMASSLSSRPSNLSIAAAPAAVAAVQASGVAGGDAPKPPPLPPHIQALGDQIRVLKEQLKAAGMKPKDIKKYPQVAAMVAQLDQVKVQSGIDPKTNFPVGMPSVPKASPKATPSPEPPKSKPLPPDLQAYGLQLKALKNSLKAAGLSDKQIKDHPQVAALTTQLNQTMRLRAGVFPTLAKRPDHPVQMQPKKAAAPAKPSPPLPPEIQAFKKNLGSLKAGLKASGLTAQQIKGHPQVAAMSAQLDQMMRAWKASRPSIQVSPSSPYTVPGGSAVSSLQSFASAPKAPAPAIAAAPGAPIMASLPARIPAAPKASTAVAPMTISVLQGAPPAGATIQGGFAVQSTCTRTAGGFVGSSPPVQMMVGKAVGSPSPAPTIGRPVVYSSSMSISAPMPGTRMSAGGYPGPVSTAGPAAVIRR